MATIIFEQVFVSQSLDGDGNKIDIYRYWKSDYGSLGRFRATEVIGYGENISYQSYNFLASGTIADRLKKMNLKPGSTLYVVGELLPETFEGKSGKLNRMVVKILDVRFASGSQKKEKEEEKTRKTEERVKPNDTPRKVSIPIPKVSSNEAEVVKPQRTNIPLPSVEQEVKAQSASEEEDIINLDIQELFSEASGFMGIENPSA